VPGKHRPADPQAAPPRQLTSPLHLPTTWRSGWLLPAAVAVGVVLILLLAGVSMFGMPGGGTTPTAADRSVADRGSRDLGRPDLTGSPSASPSPTASPSASPSAKPSAPKPSSTTPKVVSSGNCQASYYGEGQNTASGERFDPNALTAAHKTLPFNTRVRVTNVKNGRNVVVRINDRGPFVAGRCLDLSTAAFKAIASLSSGVVQVRYEVLK
jgi:rare lipoprotein A